MAVLNACEMDNMGDLYANVQTSEKAASVPPNEPAAEDRYGMDDVGDLYAKVQKKIVSASPNQPAPEELYSVAQNVPDECEYDHINRGRGMPNNSGSSTSRNFATELTYGKEEQKFIFKNPAMILAFFSLLVGIVAIGLLFVFSNQKQIPKTKSIGKTASLVTQLPISEEQHSVVESQSILLKETIRNFTQQIEMLKLEQYKYCTNLQAQLQAVKNRTTDLEKQNENTQRKLNLLTTINQTNELNNSLIILQNNISNIQNYAKHEKLQQQLSLISANVTILKLKQGNLSINLEALQQFVENKTNDTEKFQLTTKDEANELNKTLERLQENIARHQNFINLLLHTSRTTNDTEWLTLSNGFQYRRTDEKINWIGAKSNCAYLGGNVASVGIRDVSIRKFLLSYFLTKTGKGYWIGLKDRSDNKWYWIDNNKKVATNDTIWNDNEPNRADEDCAALAKRNSRVGADDVECNRRDLYGICEKAANEQ